MNYFQYKQFQFNKSLATTKIIFLNEKLRYFCNFVIFITIIREKFPLKKGGITNFNRFT